MIRQTLKSLALLFIFLQFHGEGYAQTDSAAYAQALAQFHQALFPENGLYNGGEYIDYASTLKNGHPYYGSILSQDGWVSYDGMRYERLQLWYDIVIDGLILEPPSVAYKMQLLNPKVEAFTLGDHRFVRLVRDSTRDIRTGFYELLYSGKVRLYRKSSKNIQEYVTAQAVERYIYADSTYYLERGGRFVLVDHRRSLLDALADKRHDVQVFIRRNKLSLKRGKDESLTKIITYYDGLTYADPHP
jgi:hypothetical protein